jgi:hypothetical protein
VSLFLSYLSLAQLIAVFFEEEPSSAIAACGMMLPLLRFSAPAASSHTSTASSLLSKSAEDGDAVDLIVSALMQFEEAVGPWLRETAMQQHQHKHLLIKAKKVCVAVEASAAKLNATRQATAAMGRCRSHSRAEGAACCSYSSYHYCMARC